MGYKASLKQLGGCCKVIISRGLQYKNYLAYESQGISMLYECLIRSVMRTRSVVIEIRMHLHMVYNYHIQSFLLDFGLMGEIDVSLLETEAEVFTPKLVSTKPTRGYGPLSVQWELLSRGANEIPPPIWPTPCIGSGWTWLGSNAVHRRRTSPKPSIEAFSSLACEAVECSSATLASILDLRLGDERRTDKFGERSSKSYGVCCCDILFQATQPVRETYVWGGPNLTIKVGPEFGRRPS
ncbi:hypothetical protein PHYBLDRAFT_164082 [Phycomyces blakesleeanus NRRL 1555(-)]|uniref:Uncharacterized protein n=1 Tax=Phycomyces blakesleeanus (strain ATCC 8743b / DSM 1359 / FGSC 10004 / NBRC 33097 / NRRL 1555) TaxID=763407 RepID=A0A163EJT3_PHYB8|nr:hypothetical protein PHYBLDRAFT_164082 [Phycomyces blakesleeanus NRRL 1555(-)]OAD78990.1 hypothetical protein PHYBLDRAFT_164082 [Phycomyces blakesleeanus NRRL 1555(-)]|eukprot:XP_018297030.1 hypothetical protein PHYBLDRAFT_164082 [Phycomyces blakesleeanus NRRL 1555(-)]